MYTIINRVLDLLFVFLYWASPQGLRLRREKNHLVQALRCHQKTVQEGRRRLGRVQAGHLGGSSHLGGHLALDGLHHLGHLLLVYAHRLLPRHLSRHVVVTAFAVQSAVRVGEMLEKLISRLCVGHL